MEGRRLCSSPDLDFRRGALTGVEAALDDIEAVAVAVVHRVLNTATGVIAP